MTPPPLPSPKVSGRIALGQTGEDLAAVFLRAQGLQVLARNIHCGHPELDLVCFEAITGEIVFIEVKTRCSGYFGHPSAAVQSLKLLHLRQAAGRFLREHRDTLSDYPWTGDFRFDIIAIKMNNKDQPQIEWFKNVTW